MKLIKDDYLLFEKIRRRNRARLTREERIFTKSELDLMKSQTFGSIHTIDDRKIPNFYGDKNISKDFYLRSKIRPGVVITSPSEETNYETQWVPMTTKVEKREPLYTVFLASKVENVVEDSIILLTYRSWFVFKTLSERKGKLSDEKQKELRQKLNNLLKLESRDHNE